jgi:hypothetical protein
MKRVSMRAQVGKKERTGRTSRGLQVENLEPRMLMTANSSAGGELVLSHGGICSCPICTGQGLDQLVAAATVSTAATSGLAAANLPASRPTIATLAPAPAKCRARANPKPAEPPVTRTVLEFQKVIVEGKTSWVR